MTVQSRGNLSYEFLERCEAITREFQKKGKWDMHFQLLHMYDEVTETQHAFSNGDFDNFKEECCDVILTTLTALHLLDVTPKEIQEAMEATLRKVEIRSGILVL